VTLQETIDGVAALVRARRAHDRRPCRAGGVKSSVDLMAGGLLPRQLKILGLKILGLKIPGGGFVQSIDKRAQHELSNGISYPY
jgi:hypothetical protein